jgi:membrane protein implicated in regulation of membrane protease activity
MNKYYKFIEMGYLIIAVVFLYEGITRFNTERQKAYIFLGFAVLATFTYFFKKRFRKRFEQRAKDRENQQKEE